MNALEISITDLVHHVVQFGMDVFPPIEVSAERTRLNMFAEEAMNRWPNLFQSIVSGIDGFKLTTQFKNKTGKVVAEVPTLTITQRGPVFVFPLRLMDPVGDTGLEASYLDKFDDIRKLFLAGIAQRQLMRVGMVREVLFSTGKSPCTKLLTNREEFAGAKLTNGEALIHYMDDLCNIRIKFNPAEIQSNASLAIGTIKQHVGYGLQVAMDVNNAQPRPLDDAEIAKILERACSLWPTKLLEYLREGDPRS